MTNSELSSPGIPKAHQSYSESIKNVDVEECKNLETSTDKKIDIIYR